MKINYHPYVLEIEKNIIEYRRDFHKHPELSFQEHRTSQTIAKELRSFGLEVHENIAKTGVFGILKGNKPGKTIALRADMDALPIQETSKLKFKSINEGVMHACGHDGHMAILLGAAQALSKMKSSIKGIIKFIFQPAEEGLGGAKFMIKDGVLNNVDEIYGLHLWNYQKFGTVGIQSGPVMAAADKFTIKIIGKGGHGAAPQGTIDASVVSANVIQALQTIVSRNTNPLQSNVITIGQINGGYNFNIIADKITLKGTTRSFTKENQKLIKKRMKEILSGIEKAFTCQIELNYEDGYPPLINHEKQTHNVKLASKKITPNGIEKPYLTMGGEDFSYYLNKKPGCFFFLGSSPDNKEVDTPHHCSHFNINEKSLLLGSSIFVELINQLLIKNNL
ncbi:MAG: hypothetical protein CBD97_01520 [Pelagibacteraceae bacterium TMED237]|nr:peptidase M20 [Candidatus Neomarinimicrobiota bacterium]OUW96307.1 MAG: hypothetical protein CBD97_01520 [Pelagibacteraceae bacterium TMED237]|tara:strand:- start:244 stop:1422 length:1179 start_codon:yes stop_codon:yes gene_type:complete